MKALVTGGAGFIGSHLTEHLVQEGMEVRVVDNLTTGRLQNIVDLLPDIELIKGNLIDWEVREMATEGVDVVFHVASIPSVPFSLKSPMVSHSQGSHLTALLLHSSVRAGVKKFIYSSSSSVYGEGNPKLSKEEDQLPSPISPYAATKLAGEMYVRAWAKSYDIDTCSLRYFNVYGPKQKHNNPYSGVLSLFCDSFLNKGPLVVYGDGMQCRDFTYVDDVVTANLKAAETTENLEGAVFNIASGRSYNLNHVIRILNELTDQNRVPEYRAARDGDIKCSVASTIRARLCFGFDAKTHLKDGLWETLQYMSESGKRRS